MKININKLIIRLVFLFPLGTILTSVPIIGTLVNKVLYGVFIICILLGLLKKQIKKNDVVVLVLLAIMFVYDLAITGRQMYNSNEVYYLVTWVVYLIYARTNYERFKINICCALPFVKKVIIIWDLIVGVSLALPACWSQTGAFYSFAGSQHRMDSAVVMILAGVIILYRFYGYKRSTLLLAVIPGIAVLFSGARTYLVVIGMILIVLYYYTNIKHTYRFWLTILPIAFIVISIIMSTSVMQERILSMQADAAYFTSIGYNVLSGITSGRSTFWLIDLEKYWESSLLNKVLGNGFNFVRYVNATYYTTAIWAHNDFINIICCNGVLGLILYFYAYFKMVKCAAPLMMPKKVRRFMLAAFHVSCMMNAMFNMLYSYFAAALAVPILLFAMMDDSILPQKPGDNAK